MQYIINIYFVELPNISLA